MPKLKVHTDPYWRDTKNLWFPNQVEPKYVQDDPLQMKIWKDYWKNEKDRLINGFYLANGKVYISGWLYWHTVYWNIEMYVTQNNREVRIVGTPNFRDLDWDFAVNRERALDEGKFIELVGARNFGKSVWDASVAGYHYTLHANSEVVISGGMAPDIKVVTDKIEHGLTNMHPVLKRNRLANDWKKEIRSGFKNSDGLASPDSFNSRIIIRNYEEGTKSMAANGTRPIFHVIDEIGKIPNFINCVKDSDGCWWAGSSGKPSCLPIFSGTGGEMSVGKDAAEMFFKPAAYNLLEFDDKWEGNGKIGWFVSATRSKNDCKHPKPLSEYIDISHPDLDKIEILVSDEQECLDKYINPGRERALRSGNSRAILKDKAYYPTKPSEAFIVLTYNIFHTERARKQQLKLYENNIQGIPVEIYHNGEQLVHKYSEKLPVSEFPVRSENTEGCIVVYEFPILNPPFGLYVAGVDPYKQDTAKYSDSLGAVYIYKRQHDIMGEKFQDMIVAQYVGRPSDIDEWYENARNLIKYYNAYTLCENEDKGFIDHMKYKNDGHYLANQPEFIKTIVSHSQVNREKGIHAVPQIISHLNGLVKRYTEETFHKELDEKGSVIKEISGFDKILDPMLLEEIIRFNRDGNFDRIRAFSLAIVMARHLGPDFRVDSKGDQQIDAVKPKPIDRVISMFASRTREAPTGPRSPGKSPRKLKFF